MGDDLEAARALAESIRFRDDTPKQGGLENFQSDNSEVLEHLYQHGVELNERITPSLDESLRKVSSRLGAPEGCVKAFVVASHEIQAGCFSGNARSCVVQFSSSLIDLLDTDEFCFVAGHEIGHFLLRHGVSRAENLGESVEYFLECRAQEISADRVGLVACASVEIATRALIKTASGLGGRHLRFDVGAFVAQQRASGGRGLEFSSHPSMGVRCRALLRFASEVTFPLTVNEAQALDILTVDSRVSSDLDRFANARAKEKVFEATENLAMWAAAVLVVNDNVFDQKEQMFFAERFGREKLEKMKGFFGEQNPENVKRLALEKFRQAKAQLRALSPTKFDSQFSEIQAQLKELNRSETHDLISGEDYQN